MITAVGDVMLGSTFPDESGGSLPPNDGADFLSEVTPIFQASDIAFGNLEGTMLDGGTSQKCRHARPGFCYAFRMPTRYGKLLQAAGFDVFSIANNHALDFGETGRTSTKQTLDALGIAHSGEPDDLARMMVKGKKIILIAFAPYPAFNSLLDIEKAVEIVHAAAAESDLVIVSMHAGAEGPKAQHVVDGPDRFLGENRGDLKRFTHAVIDAGAALVIGHGPHVVRGMEMYHGHLIVYSLGNFATYKGINVLGPGGITLIAEIHLGLDGSFHSAVAHPVRQEYPGGPKLDAEKLIVPILRYLSHADFGCHAVVVKDNGELLAPPPCD